MQSIKKITVALLKKTTASQSQSHYEAPQVVLRAYTSGKGYGARRGKKEKVYHREEGVIFEKVERVSSKPYQTGNY